MLLSEILNGVCDLSAYPDQPIKHIQNDSRAVQPGDLFVCLKGAAADGHDYAQAALEKGAAAIVTERDLGLFRQIIVPDTHRAYAKMAANFYGNPSKKMKLIGVTGTNGKTTCTILIKSILKRLGKQVGLIGTIHNEIGDRIVPTEKTTPDAMELEALYREMADAGCEYCVMEVSSHALDQQRIGDSHYEIGVFTNLTQDHLDYHETMEAYFAAKERLFHICDAAVINLDDPYGRQLIERCSCPVTTFSALDESADVYAFGIEYHPDSVD
ncbi:MAG: Mur ligase family protein, partial [Anaerotruncus rubiinfantis]